MRLFEIGLVAAVLFSTPACSPQSPAAPTTKSCVALTAFYPAWRAEAYPVARVDWAKLDGVATGFVLPQPDGSLNTEAVVPYLQSLVEAAHAHNDLVYVSIGGAAGYGDAFQQIGRDPSKRARFVSEVRQLVETYGIDGIDIDWEYWTWQHSQNKGGLDPDESPLLPLLLKDLRAGLPAPVRLTADIFAGDWMGAQYTPEMLAYADHVNLMAFDFTGAWASSPVGHHSSFEMTKRAVAWSQAKGFDPAKVWLGLPAYGIEFPDGRNPSARHVPQAEIAIRLTDNPEAMRRGKSGHLFFDTPDISRRKSAWATDQGLSGVFVFELTSDATGEWSLLQAARTGLADRRCADD